MYDKKKWTTQSKKLANSSWCHLFVCFLTLDCWICCLLGENGKQFGRNNKLYVLCLYLFQITFYLTLVMWILLPPIGSQKGPYVYFFNQITKMISKIVYVHIILLTAFYGRLLNFGTVLVRKRQTSFTQKTWRNPWKAILPTQLISFKTQSCKSLSLNCTFFKDCVAFLQ